MLLGVAVARRRDLFNSVVLQPALRTGQPHWPTLPTPIRPGALQPATPPRPQAPQPILPQAARPAIVQPQAGNAFALPANLTLKPRGSGQPLPEPIQQKMESFFNTSFADVRILVGHEASSIGALAFTHGTDLYFAPGQYNPQSTQGQQLLGHELTHLLQQRAGRVRNPLGSGVAVIQDPALEAEAERLGTRAASAALPIQTKPARHGSTTDPISRATTVAANGSLLPAMGAQPDSVQRRSGPKLPGEPDAVSKKPSYTPDSARFSSGGDKTAAGTSLPLPSAIVQRSPLSMSILSGLATPKTFTSPAAADQSEVAKKLDDIADQLSIALNARHEREGGLRLLTESLALKGGVFGIGAVIFPQQVPADDVLIAKAKLSEIPNGALTSYYSSIQSDMQSCNKIASFVMQTMVTAGQTAYIRALQNEYGRWQFLAEVHYYRSSDHVDNSKFHKDTHGQTLFVNLNYINDAPMAGPEYIVNAPVVAEHQNRIEKSLPGEFIDDLMVLRGGAKAKEIEYATIPTNGVVSFVDEWLHHMTPTVGLRKISKGMIKTLLSNSQSFIDAKHAIDQHSARGSGNKSTKPWKRLVLALRDARTDSMTRADWSACGLEDGDWDRLLWLEENKKAGFYSVSIPQSAVTVIEGPRLRRAMSQTAIAHPELLPTKPPGKRRFFRTWVRAVKLR